MQEGCGGGQDPHRVVVPVKKKKKVRLSCCRWTYVGFEVLIAVIMLCPVLWDIMPSTDWTEYTESYSR
jgi:hypothetical protein